MMKEHWPEVDTSLEVRTVYIPSEKRKELLNLFTSLLEKEDFIRGDYRDLAEISVIILGGKLPGDKAMVWKRPGATHKARFMAFGLLVLKIFAFSEQEVVKENCLSDVVEVEVEQIYHLLLVLHVMLVDQVGLVEVVLIKVLLVQQVIRLLQIRLKVIQVVKDKMPLLDLHLQVQVVDPFLYLVLYLIILLQMPYLVYSVSLTLL